VDKPNLMKIAKLKIKNSLLLLTVFFVAGFIFFGQANSAEAIVNYGIAEK